MVGWVFFDAQSLLQAGDTLSIMFGFDAETLASAESLYYLRSYLVPLMIAIVGCTPLPKRIAAKLENKKIMIVIEPFFVAVLLVMITAFLVDGSFNPFIYFKF